MSYQSTYYQFVNSSFLIVFILFVNISYSQLPSNCTQFTGFDNIPSGTTYISSQIFQSDGITFKVFPHAIAQAISNGVNGLTINDGIKIDIPSNTVRVSFRMAFTDPVLIRINGLQRIFQPNAYNLPSQTIGQVNVSIQQQTFGDWGIWTLDGPIQSLEIDYGFQGNHAQTFFFDDVCITTMSGSNQQFCGTIVDCKGQPLIGSMVDLKGSNSPVMTDLSGGFCINAIVDPAIDSLIVNGETIPIMISPNGIVSTCADIRVKVTSCQSGLALAGSIVEEPISGRTDITSFGGFASLWVPLSSHLVEASLSGYLPNSEPIDFVSGLTQICLDTFIDPCQLNPNFTFIQNCSSAYVQYTGPSNIDPNTTYEWYYQGNTGGPILLSSGIGLPPNQNLTTLPPGQFVVFLVQQCSNCIKDFKLAINLLAPVSFTTSIVDVTCKSNGEIKVIPSGGQGLYQVYMRQSVGGGIIQNGYTFSNVPPGSYQIFVEDINGCASATQTVSVNYVGPYLDYFCSGFGGCSNGIETDIEFRINSNQATATFFQYVLYDRTSDSEILSTADQGYFDTDMVFEVVNVMAGQNFGLIYRFILQDGTVCQDTVGNWIVPAPNVLLQTQINPPTEEIRCHSHQLVDMIITPVLDQSMNCVFNSEGSFNILINGQTYTLTNGQSTLINDISGESLNYSLIYDPLGANCISNSTIQIPFVSDLDVSIVTTDVSCGGQTNGSATISSTGGNGPRTYEWFIIIGGNEIRLNNSNYQIGGLGPGDYLVRVLDGTTDCDEEGSSFYFTIEEPDQLQEPEIFTDDCQLSSSWMDNGQGPFRVEYIRLEDQTIIYDESNISGGSGLVNHSMPSTILVEVGFHFYVRVTDYNGCQRTSPIKLLDQPPISRSYKLCVRWITPQLEPISDPVRIPVPGDSPAIHASNISKSLQNQTEECVTNQLEAIQSDLSVFCSTPDSIKDALAFSYETSAYQYTLYYRDRVNNLVRTIAPKGVNLTYINRDPVLFKHTFSSEYDFNSLSQLVFQSNPDGGEINFLYNDIGHLRFSQNSKQKDPNENGPDTTRYVYNKYDDIARAIEIGESLLTNSQSFYSLSNHVNDVDYPTLNQSQQTLKTYTAPSGLLYNDTIPQAFLDNRISQTERINLNGDTMKVHFSYDPHGNIEWMAQEIPTLDTSWIYYHYNLLSGNILQMDYNRGLRDQFFYKYIHDENNRLIEVLTSLDEIVWNNDVSYHYYKHGPLAHLYIGHDTLQKVDYVYNLQGWPKAINELDTSNPNWDIENGNIPKDGFGLTIQYFPGDFVKVGSLFNSNVTNGFLGLNRLYNGNVSNYLYKNNHPASTDPFINQSFLIQQFKYDKLNRIQFSGFNGSDLFNSFYTYDKNSNIQTLNRNGHIIAQEKMDSLKFYHKAMSNQIDYVEELQSDSGRYSGDIDSGQISGNYKYDNIGNLITDVQEGLEMTWTLDSKLSNVTTSNGHKINFTYDPFGNRVVKQINDTLGRIYIRDFSGNLLSLKEYKRDQTLPEISKTTKEILIYGTDRVGVYKFSDVNLLNYHNRFLGRRLYDLKDYLNNVKLVIKDSLSINKELIIAGNEENYPYGSIMNSRVDEHNYNFGFGSQYKDNDLKGYSNSLDFGSRIYDPRIPSYFSIDPLQKEYPSLSPYAYVASSPIMLVEVDGKWFAKFDNSQDPKYVVFVAEENDDLKSLELQLGVEKGSLTNNEQLAGLTISKGSELSSELEFMESVKSINSYLQSEDIVNTNCANCALRSNNIISAPAWATDGGIESMAQASEFVSSISNVAGSESRIGDITTFMFSLESSRNYLLTNGIQDYYRGEGKPYTLSALEPVIQNWYENQIEPQHFSVVLLKDKEGKNIQQSLEKSGTNPVQIVEGVGGGEEFEAKGKNKSDTPHYSPKAKKEE